MSGARGVRRGVGVYGRAFEERMRQRQLDVEHTRRLREIAAQGGSLGVESAMEPREPETSSAAAEEPGMVSHDPLLEGFSGEPSSSGYMGPRSTPQLSTEEKILYYAIFVLHFGLSSEQIRRMEELMTVLYGTTPPINYFGHVRELNRELLSEFNRKRYFFCTSCGNRLSQWRELCENVGCALYRVSIKRARAVQRTEIHVLNVIPQLSDIITVHIEHIIGFHRELHEVGVVAADRSDPRHFDGFREAIESAADFAANKIRILLTISVDGFVPRRLSRREVWPLYLRIENLPRSEANDYFNSMLAGALYSPSKPTETMMETLFSRLEAELNTLRETPIVVDLDGVMWTVEVRLYRGVADMAAQKILYGVPAWNRDFGCSKCTIKGMVEGRQRMWLAARDEIVSLRTPESYAEDAQNFGQFGITQMTSAMRLLLPNAFSSDSLHVCSEGVTRDRIKDMFGGPRSKFPQLRVDHHNTELIKTCLKKLSSHTYANSLVLFLEDLKTCTATELDELAFVTFPLVAATGMIQSPVAAASLLGYWFCLRTMAHSKSLTLSAIREAQSMGTCVKQIWAELAPEVFTMKCHWFFEHGMADELDVYGSMYQWSSAPFESLHRRLQLRIDQSTTNSSIEMIERYILSKRVRNMFYNCCEDGNTTMLALKSKIENKHKRRFPLAIRIDDCTYIPKGSRIAPGLLSEDRKARITVFREEAYSRLVISGKVYSSRLYWNRARSSRQDVVYLCGRDGDEELDHFASILMFLYNRRNKSIKVLVEEFVSTDPFEHLSNLVNHTPHPCRRTALQIMRSISASNNFFKEITGQRIRVRPLVMYNRNRNQRTSSTSRTLVFTPSTPRTASSSTPRSSQPLRDRTTPRSSENVVPEEYLPIERQEEVPSGNIYHRPEYGFETPRPPAAQRVSSLFSCIANGVIMLKPAAELIHRQKRQNQFNKTVYEEFVNSETTAHTVSFCFAGLSGTSGNDLELRLIALQLQGDISAAKLDKLTRRMDLIRTSQEPQKTLVSLRNCRKTYDLEAPPPFARVSLNDLVLDYNFNPNDNRSAFQKFASLYRVLFQRITDPPYRIQEYSVRVNAKGGRDRNLKDLPRSVEILMMDFVEDLIGYGTEEARTGELASERQFYRGAIFNALQVALRDVRQSQYDHNAERFVPSSRKGKRVRVSGASGEAGAGDENVSP